MKSKKLSALIIAVAIAAAACQSSSQSNGQSATDTPQAQSTSAPLATGACANPYVPVVEGATWTYSGNTDVAGDFTRTVTITDVGTDAFLVEWVSDPLSGVTTWTCTPDGLIEDQSNGGVFSAVLTGPDATVNVQNLSNTGFTIAADPQPGDSWTQVSEISALSSEGFGFDGTLTVEFTAVGMEAVSVPAGSFNALRVDVHAEATYQALGSSLVSTLTWDGSDWFAPGVGRVQSVGAMSEPSAFTYELNLESYSIP
jgi:hypothetical protein